MKRSTRMIGGLLAAGMIGSFLPQMVPLEWVDVQPVEWEAPAWSTQVTVEGEPDPVDAATLEGVHPIRVLNTDVGVNLRALLVPGATPSLAGERLDDLTHADLQQIVRDAEEVSGEVFTPQPGPNPGCVVGSTTLPFETLLADPELAPVEGGTALNCDVVFAAGEMLSVRTRTTTGESDETRVHLIDVVDGTRSSPVQLWQAEATSDLWPLIVDAVRRDARGISTVPIVSIPDGDLIERILEETILAADGTAVLTVPKGFRAPELEGLLPEEGTADRITVRLEEAVVESRLSPLGVYVQALVREDRVFGVPVQWAGQRRLDCSLVACVALTFDGGPNEFTPVVMDALYSADAAGTFFVRGDLAEGFPEALHRGVSEGHSIQNGTQTGANLAEITDSLDLRAEITSGRNTIADLTGDVPTMLRPATRLPDDAAERVVDAVRMPVVWWDLDAGEDGVDVPVGNAQRGSIIRIPEDAAAYATVGIIAGLQERGFELVTVRQLFNGIVPPPGIVDHAR